MEWDKEKQKKYINEWQKEKRIRILVLATIEEGNAIKEQAKKEGLSLTRYLIKCHNEYIEQANKNATIREKNNSKGIMYNNREK